MALSEEQKKRMEQNRQAALAKRKNTSPCNIQNKFPCQAPTLDLRGPPQSLSFPASGCLDLLLIPPDLHQDLDLDPHQDPDLSLARKSLLGSQFRLAKTSPGKDYWSLIGQWKISQSLIGQ